MDFFLKCIYPDKTIVDLIKFKNLMESVFA